MMFPVTSNRFSQCQARWMPLLSHTTPRPRAAGLLNTLKSDACKNVAIDYCPILHQGLPELRHRFNEIADRNNGVFPMLSSTDEATMFKHWNPHDYPNKRASVLIALYSDNGEPSILFTARSPVLPIHPSEISFPGGHVQSNESLEDAALREAHEELGGDYPWHDPNHLVILGKGSTFPAATGTPVTPIIVVITRDFGQQSIHEFFPGDSSEVEAVFGMHVRELLKTESIHKLPDHPLVAKQTMGPRYLSPHGYIWGLTAFMIQPLLHRLYKPVFRLEEP